MAAEYPGDGDLARSRVVATRSRGLGCGKPLCVNGYSLAVVQEAVLAFLRDRTDAALFGAQAVNAYVSELRMTQDVDILAVHAAELAGELRDHLRERFHLVVRVCRIAAGRGFRIFQTRRGAARHLADIRIVDALPPIRKIGGIAVVSPEELIAVKVFAFHHRSGQPRSFTDHRDIAVLLLKFPQPQRCDGAVRRRLQAAGAGPPVLAVWRRFVNEPIKKEDENNGF